MKLIKLVKQILFRIRKALRVKYSRTWIVAMTLEDTTGTDVKFTLHLDDNAIAELLPKLKPGNTYEINHRFYPGIPIVSEQMKIKNWTVDMVDSPHTSMYA